MTDEEWDEIYERIDNLCWKNDWDAINDELKPLVASDMSKQAIVCWLSITHCVAEHLPERARLAEEAKKCFSEELLRGLV